MFDYFNMSAIMNSFKNVRRVENNQKLLCALDELIDNEDGKKCIYEVLSKNINNDSILNDLYQMIWYDKAYCGKISWKDLFEIVTTYGIDVEECLYLISTNATLSLSQVIDIISVKYRNGFANKPFDVVDIRTMYRSNENVIDAIESLLNINFHSNESTEMTVEDFWSFVQTGALDSIYFRGSHFMKRNKNVSVGEFNAFYKLLRITSNRSAEFCLSFLLNYILNSDCDSRDIPCIYYSDEYGTSTNKYVIFSLRTWKDKFGMSTADSDDIRFQNILNSIIYFYYKERSGKSGKLWNERPKKYYTDLENPIDGEYPDVPTFSCVLREKNSEVHVLTSKEGINYLITDIEDTCKVLGYVTEDAKLQLDKLSQNIITRTKGVNYRISDAQTKLQMKGE